MKWLLELLCLWVPFLKDGLYLYFDMCIHCYDLPAKIKCTPTSYVGGGHIGEERADCLNCGGRLDYFAYGVTEKEVDQGMYENEWPVVSRLMEKLSSFVNHAKTLYNRG